MLAGAHGQVWNASAIGRSLGLSYHTVDSYLDYLEGAFLIRRLRPLHANLRKRLVKSPKVYWRDSGLLHSTLNVRDQDDLLGQPWVGASWEGFVIEQVLGAFAALGLRHEACFLRTSDGQELDLVVDVAGHRWALEIKLTASPSPRDMAQVDRLAEMIGASRRYVVSQVEVSSGDVERASCNLPWLLGRIRSGASPR
jgi:predicted AAA+ superfamily ATPase